MKASFTALLNAVTSVSSAPPDNQGISFRPLFALSYAGVSARIFYLCAVDYPKAGNAGWLIPLAGAFLALPAFLCACLIVKRHPLPLSGAVRCLWGESASRLIFAVLCLVFSYETACMFRILTGSAEYATLYNTPTSALLIPTGILILLVALKGGNGVAGCATLWLRLFPLFYGIILLIEIESAEICRMFPIFGEGVSAIWEGALSAAGIYSYMPLCFILGDGKKVNGRGRTEKPHAFALLHLLFLTAVSCTALLLFHTLVFPHIPALSQARSVRLDILLSKGRENLAVQLPIMVAWFASLAIASAFFLYAAGRFASLAAPGRERLAVCLCGLFALIVAIAKLSTKDGAMLLSRLVALPASLFFIIALVLCEIKAFRSRKR